MAKSVKVDVILTQASSSDGKLTGEVVPASGHGGSHKNGLVFPKGDSYDITFHLRDDTGYGLRFPVDSPADALWIGPMGVCPVQAPGNGNGELTVTGATDKTLSVHDANAQKGEYMYMLRFRSNREPDKWFWLDPVIENGGGGHPMSQSTITAAKVAVAVGAVAAAAAAVYLLT
jgi:hypothetical protein